MLFLMSFVAFFLQCTLLKAISLALVSPNLLLIITAVVGYQMGPKYGSITGMFCGFFSDLFFGTYIGIHMLIYLYIGYLNGRLRSKFNDDSWRLPFLFVGASDIAYGLVVYFIFYLLRGRFNFGYYLLNIIIPETVYTLLMLIPLYFILIKIIEQFADDSKRGTNTFAL